MISGTVRVPGKTYSKATHPLGQILEPIFSKPRGEHNESGGFGNTRYDLHGRDLFTDASLCVCTTAAVQQSHPLPCREYQLPVGKSSPLSCVSCSYVILRVTRVLVYGMHCCACFGSYLYLKYQVYDTRYQQIYTPEYKLTVNMYESKSTTHLRTA